MRNKGLRRWLAVGGVCFLVALGISLFSWRHALRNPKVLQEVLPEGTHITIGEVSHTAVRDGRKEWVLKAASASYDEKTREATFKSVTVTFFRSSGETIEIEGRDARADTQTNAMEVTGDVVIRRDQLTLATERLNYDPGQDRLISRLPVTIEGPAVHLRSDQLEIDLKNETAQLQGHVEGVFNVSQSILP
jgi:LPS export ABC transporter protein LptC